MIAQLSNIQQFFAAHMSDVLDWGKHVRPDPERKTSGDAAYVLIDTGLNRYKLGCLSTYIDPPAGASYQCKALGTITFDDFGGQKHIIAPKLDATWMEISKHIHVRELTDGLAIARRELAEASPETVGAVRVRVAELVARAQKWGVEAKGLPVLAEVPKTAAPSSQWPPEEPAGPSEMRAKSESEAFAEAPVPELVGKTTFPIRSSIDKPFLGCPIIFITNPGEAVAGMTEIIGWCVNVHSDEAISAFITPDHSEPSYRDKLARRNPAKNIRSNCWDFNERLMAPFRMADQIADLGKRIDGTLDRLFELEQKVGGKDNLAAAKRQSDAIKAQAQHDAAEANPASADEPAAKRGPGRPRKVEAA